MTIIEPTIEALDSDRVRITFGTAPTWARVRVVGWNRIGGDTPDEGGDEGGGTPRYVAMGGYLGLGYTENALFVYPDSGGTVPTWEADPDGEHYAAGVVALAANPDGQFAVAGNLSSTYEPGEEYEVALYSAGGTALWSTRLQTGAQAAVALMPSGNVATVATRRLMNLEGSVYGSVIVRGSSDGSLVWYKDTGGNVGAVAVDESGNVYAGGARASSLTVWSWDAAGTARWSIDTTGAVNDAAVDPTQTWLYVRVAGTPQRLRRLALSDGADGTASGWPIDLDDDFGGAQANALACDAEGDIYLLHWDAGVDYGVLRSWDSAGSARWATSIPENHWPNALAVSPEGHAYVIGSHLDTGERMCWKFETATGGTVTTGWPVGWDAGDWDQADAVAVTPGPVGTFPAEWGI